MRRLGSESLVYGLSSIVGRFLSYLLTPYYAYAFTPAENGVQSVVYTYIPLASLVFLLGLEVAYMRGAAATRDADLTTRQRTFSMSFGTIAAVGAVGMALGWVAAPWLAEVVKLPVYAVRYILAIVYTDALLTVRSAQLRIGNQAKRYAALKLLFAGASIALNVILIGVLRWDVSAIFFSNLVANLAVLLLMLPIILRLFRPGTLRGAEWGPLWRYALPLIPAALAVAAGGERRPHGPQRAPRRHRARRVQDGHQGGDRHLLLQLQAGRGDAPGRADVPHGVDALFAHPGQAARRAAALFACADGADDRVQRRPAGGVALPPRAGEHPRRLRLPAHAGLLAGALHRSCWATSSAACTRW